MPKNCMKISKLTLLGQNSEETCRGKVNFLGSKGLTPTPRENFGTKFKLKLRFNFLDQICFKKHFRSRTEKRKHHHLILHIQTSLGTNFCLKWQFWLFWPNFPKKGMSSQNKKKSTAPMNSSYFAYKLFLNENRKSEHYHWILHTQITVV